MALFSFGLPAMEIASGKEPVAIIFTSARRFSIRKIKLIDNKYFILGDRKMRGIYETDDKNVFFYEKTPVFFFDYRNGKPENPLLVNELNRFADKNKLAKISRKDVKHAETLRILSDKTGSEQEGLEKTIDVAQKNQQHMEQSINAFFAQAEKDTKQAAEAKQPPPYGTHYEFVFALTNFLQQQNLLSKEEAMLLEERVRSNNMTFDELISELRSKEVVSIRTPITIDCQRFLDDFHTYDPARMSSNVDYLNRLDKKLKTMTSIPVKNWIPASLVLAISIGGIIGFMVLVQNWPMISSGLGKMLPNAPPHFILGLKSLIMNKLNL